MNAGSDSVSLDNGRQEIAPAFTGVEPGRAFYEGLTLESPLVLIDQELINAFAEMSGDRNPVHLDPEFAQSVGFKTTIAHGALVFSKATGLAYGLGCLNKVGVVLTETDLVFKRPVHAGDQIGLRLKIEKVNEERPGLVQVLATVKVVNQVGKTVQEYEWRGFFKSSPSAGKLS